MFITENLMSFCTARTQFDVCEKPTRKVHITGLLWSPKLFSWTTVGRLLTGDLKSVKIMTVQLVRELEIRPEHSEKNFDNKKCQNCNNFPARRNKNKTRASRTSLVSYGWWGAWPGSEYGPYGPRDWGARSCRRCNNGRRKINLVLPTISGVERRADLRKILRTPQLKQRLEKLWFSQKFWQETN